MKLRRARGGLSLRGWSVGKGGGKMTLTGRNSQFSAGGSTASKDWLNFKLYIIDNFLQPLNKLNYDLVKKNYYNFDFIISRLDGFITPDNEEEITLFKKLVNLMRYSTETHMSYREAKEKMYGGKEMMKMLVETSRIILKAPFEIYNLLFGRPDKFKSITHTRYEDHLILEIEKILRENPGILFDDVKKKMAKYAYKFIDASGCEVGCGEWVCRTDEQLYPTPVPVDKSGQKGPSNKGSRQGCACRDPSRSDFTPHGNLGQPCKKCGC
jgi:hypothetical protein